MEELKQRALSSERLQARYNRLTGSTTTYDEVHMHLSLIYSIKGPPKSPYFQALGTSVSDFCTNITKFGEVERVITEVRQLFGIREEEDTFVSDEEWVNC